MKFSYVCFAAGLMAFAGASSAVAADFGGIKNIGGGVAVPVPAPAPVPTYDWDSDWYVGVSVGANLSQSATITDTDRDYLGDTSQGFLARKSGDIGASPIYGLNFGRYITPSLRAEIAIDYSPEAQISKSGKLGYLATNSAPNFSVGGVDTNVYSIGRYDSVRLSRTTGLVNLLYDINTGTRFTPYIGGGVGLAWRSLRRSYSEDHSCLQGFNSNDPALYGPSVCSTNVVPSASASSGSSSKSQLDFAAAVQAGVSYNFNENVVWDNGWQMLWEGNSISSVAASASGENIIAYKDSVLQQFRSGIRLKFN